MLQADERPYDLPLRSVELPPGDGHPIDRLLAPYFKRHGIEPPEPVSDAAFARRAWLDVIGLLPTPAELEAFLTDTRPEKHERLVRRLLSEHDAYVAHWMTFWSDHLRIGSAVDGGVFDNDNSGKPRAIVKKLLDDNVPYDRLVRELIAGDYFRRYATSMAPKGEVAEPVRRPEMQMAQIFSQKSGLVISIVNHIPMIKVTISLKNPLSI